jgi:hypothetical protein
MWTRRSQPDLSLCGGDSPGTTPVSAGRAAVTRRRARKKINPATVWRVNRQEAPLLDRKTILDALHRLRQFVQARDSYCVRLYGRTLVADLRVLARPLKVSLKTGSRRAAPLGYAADQIGLSLAAVKATEKLVRVAIRLSQAGDYVAAGASIQKAIADYGADERFVDAAQDERGPT